MRKKIMIVVTTISLLLSSAPQVVFAFKNNDVAISSNHIESVSLNELFIIDNNEKYLAVLENIELFKEGNIISFLGTIKEGNSLIFRKNNEDFLIIDHNNINEIEINSELLANNDFLTILKIGEENEVILELNSQYLENGLDNTVNNENKTSEKPEEINTFVIENSTRKTSEEVEDDLENEKDIDIEETVNQLEDLESLSSKYSYPRSSEVNQKLYGGEASGNQNDSTISMFSFNRSGMSNQNYIDSIAPMAIEVANQTGTPPLWPSLMIAQAIHESNFGKSGLAKAPNHNLFGIKGTYKGDYVTMKTWEVIDGKNVYVDAAFRKYPSYKESFQDYANLMRNGLSWDNNYYSGTWRNNTSSVWEVLDNGGLRGYATDPNYFSKVRQYINNYDLTKYDTGNYYVRTGTFLSEGFTKKQVNMLKKSNNNLNYSIKIADDITPYSYRRIESTKEFMGASAANNALSNLIRDTGWSGTIIPTGNRIQRFRVLSGFFNSYQEAEKASREFKKESGLSVNIEEGSDGKYRLRTGFFNGYQSAQLGVRYMNNMGWSARVTESNDYTLSYKIRTGTFNTPGHVKLAKEYFTSNGWGGREDLDSKNNYYYRIYIEGFIYEEEALKYVSHLRNSYGWSSFALPVVK